MAAPNIGHFPWLLATVATARRRPKVAPLQFWPRPVGQPSTEWVHHRDSCRWEPSVRPVRTRSRNALGNQMAPIPATQNILALVLSIHHSSFATPRNIPDYRVQYRFLYTPLWRHLPPPPKCSDDPSCNCARRKTSPVFHSNLAAAIRATVHPGD